MFTFCYHHRGWTNGRTDQSGSAFTRFLGRYFQSDAFPHRTFSIPPLGINKIFVSFDFYEIDGWDGDSLSAGTDKFLVSISGDVEDEIDFGWFQYAYSEPSAEGVSQLGHIKWTRQADTIENSPQGFDPILTDQRHFIQLEIPPSFIRVGEELKLTIKWSLVATADEAVGMFMSAFVYSNCLLPRISFNSLTFVFAEPSL